MKRCTKCVLPETVHGLTFDDDGVCSLCRNIHQRDFEIDWKEREKQLIGLLEDAKKKARQNGSPWDCVIASSGGKDSTYQTYILKHKYGMRPIAVTYNGFGAPDNWMQQLETTCGNIGCEHILVTPRRDVVAHIARRGLELIGDQCWHCHRGCFTASYNIALKEGVPLVVFGEPPSESRGELTYEDCNIITKDLILSTCCENLRVEDFVSDGITLEDLHQFVSPPDEEFNKVTGIWLGYYLHWDFRKQMDIVKDKCGWKEWQVPDNESSFHHIDCKYCGDSGVRDYTKYLKRGYGRFAQRASAEVRAGRMSRSEARKEAEKDGRKPTLLAEYLSLIGMTEQEFYTVVKRHIVKPWAWEIANGVVEKRAA